MKLKPLFALISCFIIISDFANAQSPKEQFIATYKKGDNDATLVFLNKWKKANPNDPELYVCYYNFYAEEGLKEVVSMTTSQPQGKSLEIKDKSGKIVGYLGGTDSHNDSLLQKGFNYIDTGITKFPNRLDMRFGKIYVLGRIKNYQAFTTEIVKTIDYGESIGLKWTWTEGKILENPKEFMLSSVQSYVIQLYNEGKEYSNNIKSIAETVLKYHPNEVEYLSDLAISYFMNKDYKDALIPLLKAEKINPKDGIVINNIAFAYNQLGDKPNAIKYYQLVTIYGDEAAKANAKEILTKLGN